MLSFITVCKNRLPHLKQTLPLMLEQAHSEVIVVDYGCEQGTAAWVKEHHPTAKLVQVDDDPAFCLARARNKGAENASHEFLCFIDADVLLHHDLGKWLELHPDPNRFYLHPVRKEHELNGFVIVAREHFIKVGGYDEAFRSWGGEDRDLYERLARAGLSRSPIPPDSISPIRHGNDLRQLDRDSTGVGSTRETLTVIELYSAIKRDSWSLTGMEIEMEKRKELYQYIQMLMKDAHIRGQKAIEISINVPMESKDNVHLKGHRWLNYKAPVGQPVRRFKRRAGDPLP